MPCLISGWRDAQLSNGVALQTILSLLQIRQQCFASYKRFAVREDGQNSDESKVVPESRFIDMLIVLWGCHQEDVVKLIALCVHYSCNDVSVVNDSRALATNMLLRILISFESR